MGQEFEATKKPRLTTLQEILALSDRSALKQPNPDYRSRLSRQAEALLQKQSSGKFLDNTAKRIIARYQRQQLWAIVPEKLEAV